MDPRGERLSPERVGKAGFGENSADRFHDGAIGALRDSVLLRAIARRVARLDAVFAPEVVPALSNELATLVVLQSLDLASGAIFGPSLELDECVKRVRLALERISSVEAGCVVVECDKC